MCLFVSMTRTLVIFLLTLRVLAAPLAMRPEQSRTPANFHLVARVCAWPVQSPRRSLLFTSLVPSFRGRGPGHAEGRGYGNRHLKLLSGACALSTWLVSPARPGPSSGQLTVCLRC